MFRKVLLTTILTLLSTASFAANIPCHSCSEVSYEARAVGAGIGRHYVFDYPQGNLRRYSVRCGSAINSVNGGTAARNGNAASKDELRVPAATAACGPGARLQAEIMENDPRIVDGFLGLKWFWDETGGTMTKWYEVNFTDLPGSASYPGASAYDVASDANFRSRLGQMVTVPEVTNLLALIFGAGQGFAGFTEGIVIVYKVRFADGTESEYELVMEHDRAQYNPRTSFTPDGQLIPEGNQADFAGTWNTTYGNFGIGAFLEHLQQLGIPVYGSGGNAIRCTWDGRTLTCRFI